MGRNAKDFSRFDVKTIASEYASSKDEVSASYFCEMHNITEAVFYGVLKRAIVESIVSDDVANVIANKAARNSERHGGEGGKVRSVYHYERLMHERRKFEFTKKEKIWYATEYAKSPSHVDAKTFTIRCIMTRELFDRTIRSAIVDGLVSDIVARELMGKALQHNKEERVRPFFDGLFAERKEKLEAKKAHEKELREKSRKRAKTAESEKTMKAAEEKLRRDHEEFIQLGIHDFGIPDEMEEQLNSLESTIDAPSVWDVPDEDDETDTECEGQISFFD